MYVSNLQHEGRTPLTFTHTSNNVTAPVESELAIIVMNNYSPPHKPRGTKYILCCAIINNIISKN